MTGEWPKGEIDHIDLDRANNKWENLREATHSENSANRRVRSDNILGLKGVAFDKTRGEYRAYIGVNGKRIHLGYSDCPAAAHMAYVVAANKAFGEFARG